jgi:hypothetical protein
MNELFTNLCVAGLLRPGEVYLLSPWEDGFESEPLSTLYVIRTEAELREAVIMEFQIITYDDRPIRKFLGVTKIRDDTFEFKCLLYRADEDAEFEFSFYLYRLRSFAEEQKNFVELYINNDYLD